MTTISLEKDSKFLRPWTFNFVLLSFRFRVIFDFVKLRPRYSLLLFINSNWSFLRFWRARFKINPSFSRLFLVEPGVLLLLLLLVWKECFEEENSSPRRILELLNNEEGVILSAPSLGLWGSNKSSPWYLDFSSVRFLKKCECWNSVKRVTFPDVNLV